MVMSGFEEGLSHISVMKATSVEKGGDGIPDFRGVFAEDAGVEEDTLERLRGGVGLLGWSGAAVSWVVSQEKWQCRQVKGPLVDRGEEETQLFRRPGPGVPWRCTCGWWGTPGVRPAVRWRHAR